MTLDTDGATDRDTDVPAVTQADRARAIAERVVERVGGLPAVQTLLAVFASYDGIGGGLTAAGLAYSALFALVPGLLLVLSVVGVLVDDAAIRETIAQAIGAAFPPLEAVASAAFEQVSAGAVPTGIIAFIGLLWGSSRFYASLDYAFTKIFHTARRRNELERGARGILVSALFIALPIVLVIVGSTLSLVLSLAPGLLDTDGIFRTALQLGGPLSSLVIFAGGLMLVYRYVPTVKVPFAALAAPSILAGLTLAVFTQLFAYIAPRMLGWAALFGALVTVFALLVWLSISLNVLLLGACWTRVRTLASDPAMPADGPVDGGLATPV